MLYVLIVDRPPAGDRRERRPRGAMASFAFEGDIPYQSIQQKQQCPSRVYRLPPKPLTGLTDDHGWKQISN